ncbi:Zip-domain-containing protein [Periconia macrospinosa]|uniref:Zip-domain-containing protein n=1 Tax=Periconia macrospinosa TaxID=97972 RepID=A0A2V1DTX9_9PLEO|nr:Zip-domain-containing protein [Periconia macrospinosa]
MNCPSRTDEEILLNPGWNQNPPRFAADLTTCQDLNGIANARELGDAERWGLSNETMEKCQLVQNSLNGPDSQEGAGLGAKDPHRGSCTHMNQKNIYLFDAPQAEHSTRDLSRNSTLKGWITWTLSVVFTSLFLSFMKSSGTNFLSNMSSMSWAPKASRVSSEAAPIRMKRDTCATGGVGSNYDLNLHVGALFIILFVSSTGCAFPMLVIKFPQLRIPASFLFSVRHFGTGVLIATAFVHLLPTAFISLLNPCLSSFWTEDYPSMPGAISLAAVFFVTLVEMIFSPGRHCAGGHADIAAVSRDNKTESATEEQNRTVFPAPSTEVRNIGRPLQGRTTSISRTLSRMGEENEILDAAEARNKTEPQSDAENKLGECVLEDTERNESVGILTPEQAHKKAVMQCFLLEMGILFHSVFIGMSLSVSVGSEFVILLIAIIFHQTFEGLALGARIGAINWPKGALQPWFMALAYGCTTPLGQAIGIATHSLYSPDSEIGLLIVGIMNAISAGLLIFASLVELMSEDFLSDESWVVLRGRKRVYACILVFLGAFLMSLVGAWA